MNKLSIRILIWLMMLFSSAMVWGQKHEKELSFALSGMADNTYSFTRTMNKRWEAQEHIKRIATDKDLDSLARYCRIPAVKALAFLTLAQKQSDKCFEIVVSSLKDTSQFLAFTYDMGRWLNIASFFLDVVNVKYEEGISVLSDEQMIHLDSLIVFTPGLRHIYMTPYATRVAYLQDIHDRVKELFYEGHPEVLPLLASYKRPEDKLLLLSALREFKVGLDEKGRITGRKGATDDALEAIKNWPDEAFIPALEEIRDYELASNYFSYSETIPLFKAVMAYDNDWAYNFIEDMFIFITVAAKHESSFSECLYRAFKEETERQRFKPLIEKFGKNHLYVKD